MSKGIDGQAAIDYNNDNNNNNNNNNNSNNNSNNNIKQNFIHRFKKKKQTIYRFKNMKY